MTDKKRLEHSKLYLLGFSLEVKKSKTIREVPRVEKSYIKTSNHSREGLLPQKLVSSREKKRRIAPSVRTAGGRPVGNDGPGYFLVFLVSFTLCIPLVFLPTP